MRNIYSQIPEFSKEITPLVIATVIFTRGSAPQKAGSSALFSRDGLIDGTIGGGVLEGRVMQLASEAAVSGYSGIHNFELDKSIEHKTEAICGGEVSVLIESRADKYVTAFQSIDGFLQGRKPCAVLTVIKGISGDQIQIDRMVVTKETLGDLPDELRDRVSVVTRKLLDDASGDNFLTLGSGKPGEKKDELILVEALFPLPQLVIAGAGHIGKALHHLGKLLDFEVTVIDDRTDYANPVNLPDATYIIVKDVGEAVSELDISKDTYIVIVTRGHNDDGIALRECIKSNARYIGMIGSRTKIEKMRRNFIENGWANEKQWNAIHSPVGIEINSRTVQEIAVSIAAEMILVRNST
jgi:xanthine dehydrogenase accessory factor